MSNSRRRFLQNSLAATIASVGIPQLLQSANPQPSSPINMADGMTVLFQGDSITDAHRHKDKYYPNDALGMGNGYVLQSVGQLLGQHPDKAIRCYNRGISGHKVFQLAARWEDDCLHLSPDVLSILIGVNDYWHTLNGSYDGTVEVYEADLRKLLDRTKKELPQVKLILGEPFAVKGGRAINEKWEAFHAYRHAAKKIATDYGAYFIPYHSIFDKALATAPVSYWCPDGVHPSIAGAHLMAEAWMEGFRQVVK